MTINSRTDTAANTTATVKEEVVSESGCPVKGATARASWLWGGNIPQDHPPVSNPSKPSSSVDVAVRPVTTVSNLTANGYNEAANDGVFDHQKQPGQLVDLSTNRETSSIPNSPSFRPAHQPSSSTKWVYPSEQQYYNAMKKKGYDPPADHVPIVLAIHNIVNEQGWSKIIEWEAIRGNTQPKLKRFMGRPKDISPKAYIRSLIGYTLPFDRHDWIVERSNGDEVRYVIDYYKGSNSNYKQNQPAKTPIFLDVRPALDSPTAVIDTLSRFYRENFRNIFKID